MPDFIYTKTRLVERDVLLKAIRDMGFFYRQSKEHGLIEIRGSGGRRTHVEITVRTREPDYDIGLRKTGDTYEVVADWWGIRSITRQEFVRRLTQRYAYYIVRAKIAAQGFSLMREEIEKGGEVHFVLDKVLRSG